VCYSRIVGCRRATQSGLQSRDPRPTLPQWAPLGVRVTVIRDRTCCLACRLGEMRGHICLENVRADAVVEALSGMGARCSWTQWPRGSFGA